MGTRVNRLARGDESFEGRIDELLFNKLPFGRLPEALVSPRSEDEVVEAVRAARRDGRRISILSGGHSWIGAPLRESGVLLDLSAFDRIEVDVAARTARVGAAARSGVFAKALAAEGLAFPSGHCGTPAFAGYVLGGGLGLNWGRWKPACYSLRRVRVVTAAGEVVDATESENPDLLWLARGCGPGFPGVATEFEVELQDRPADTRLSSWLFDLDDLAAVARWVDEASPALSPKVEVATALLGPDRPEFLPAEGYPECVVTVSAMVFADDEREARAAVGSLAAGPGVPVLAHGDLDPIPFEGLSDAFDAEYPEDHRYLADSFWTDEGVEGSLTRLREQFTRAPSGKNNVIAVMPGNGSRLGLPLEAGAFSMDERTLVMHYAIWQDPAADAPNREWIGAMSGLLEPIATGHFISEADLIAHPGRLERSFLPDHWARVQELRASLDPEGVFHGMPGES
ncbi:MAG: FAD-binding oxidoreductase [Actinobacteria bacterium]|nr:FAD-binding oxidoreductase [Actinomycetota bacterium]